MSWVTIIWAMIASACLTLALVHVLVWCLSFLGHGGDSAGNPGVLGNHSCAHHNELVLYGYRGGDGL
jgi:hypothetical protein